MQVNEHSGLTPLEIAVRNLQSEARYYRAANDVAMATRLEAEAASTINSHLTNAA